jgi:hypothetical protein
VILNIVFKLIRNKNNDMMAAPSHNRRLSSKNDVKFTIEDPGLVKKHLSFQLLLNRVYWRIKVTKE